MEAYLMLCDAAEVMKDRAFVLGGGWVNRDARMPGMAVVVLLDVPWDQANRKHEMEIALQDEDGNIIKPDVLDIDIDEFISKMQQDPFQFLLGIFQVDLSSEQHL